MRKLLYCLTLGALGLVFLSPEKIPGEPPRWHGFWRAIDFSPDGKHALVMGFCVLPSGHGTHSTLGLLDVSNAELTLAFFDAGFPGKFATAAFSPDGKMVVSGGRDSTIRFWDISSRKEIRVLKTKSNQVNSLSFSADGKYLLSGESEGLFLWDVSREQQIRKISGQKVFSVAVSKNGKLALSNDQENLYTAVLWDVETAQEIRRFSAYKGAKRLKGMEWDVDQVAFCPGDTQVCYCRGFLWIWNVKTGALVRDLRPPVGSFESFSFTATGRFVLTTSMSGPNRLWELATAKEVLTLKTISIGQPSVAVSPDGKKALSADARELILWDLHNGSIISRWPPKEN